MSHIIKLSHFIVQVTYEVPIRARMFLVENEVETPFQKAKNLSYPYYVWIKNCPWVKLLL